MIDSVSIGMSAKVIFFTIFYKFGNSVTKSESFLLDGSHDCIPEATCENYEGYFLCDCPTGFIGNGDDDQGCFDLDECLELMGEYSQCPRGSRCINTFGSYHCDCDSSGFKSCLCNAGYTDGDDIFNPSDPNCIDVDECSFAFPICTGSSSCDNLPGSYSCNGIVSGNQNA